MTIKLTNHEIDALQQNHIDQLNWYFKDIQECCACDIPKALTKVEELRSKVLRIVELENIKEKK